VGLLVRGGTGFERFYIYIFSLTSGKEVTASTAGVCSAFLEIIYISLNNLNHFFYVAQHFIISKT